MQMICVDAYFMNKDGGLSHKLHGLDHLRAFAIIFVFFYHYGQIISASGMDEYYK